MRKEFCVVGSKQMSEWVAICEEYAKLTCSKVLFVNDHSCGIEYSNHLFAHIYIDDMIERVKLIKENSNG